LNTWNTGTNFVEEIQAMDDGNGLTETVKSRVVAPLSSVRSQFISVRVWLKVTTP